MPPQLINDNVHKCIITRIRIPHCMTYFDVTTNLWSDNQRIPEAGAPEIVEAEESRGINF